MTPTERLVAQKLHELADVPVTELDLERAHEAFRVRLRRAPAARRARAALLVAIAAMVVAVAAGWWVWGPHSQRAEPADRPSHEAVAIARRAATGFVEAFASYDVPHARAWLAPRAQITGELADSTDWSALDRYFRATGSRLLPAPCRLLTRTAGETTFRCGFRYYALRAQQLGRGPYSGSFFDIGVRRGRITLAFMHFEYQNGFNAQMWSPFAAWMNRNHPADAAVMYTNWPMDNQWRLTDRAIRLWSQRTRDFVQHVRASGH